MTSPTQRTLVTFLLDRSGSMASILADTIGGFNAYVAGLKAGAAADRTDLTLLMFDSQAIDKVCVGLPAAQVADLTESTFVPRGGTPLVDAAYKTIKAVEKSLEGKTEPPQVVVTILTDGEENCSSEHTFPELAALIKEKIAAGWQFNFLGAGIDAYTQSAKLGISVANTMSYNSADAGATQSAFRDRGMSHSLYASGAIGNTQVSMSAKMAAGDVFDPSLKTQAGGLVQHAPTAPVQAAPRVTTSFVKPRVKTTDDITL